MTKEKMFELAKDAKMQPLTDDEAYGTQVGWFKMTTSRIPALDTLDDDMGGMIRVHVQKLSNTYQYTVHCPVSWFMD